MTAYKSVAKKETADDDNSIVNRELIIENTNKATDDPNADTAIVPFRPSLVSINQDAI